MGFMGSESSNDSDSPFQGERVGDEDEEAHDGAEVSGCMCE